MQPLYSFFKLTEMTPPEVAVRKPSKVQIDTGYLDTVLVNILERDGLREMPRQEMIMRRAPSIEVDSGHFSAVLIIIIKGTGVRRPGGASCNGECKQGKRQSKSGERAHG